MNGISNHFINKVFDALPTVKFDGVYSCNSIPQDVLNKKTFFLICNLSEEGETGSHFIALIKKNRKIAIYDSLATDMKHYPSCLKKTLAKHKVYTKIKHSIQDILSHFCGFYSIYFILSEQTKIQTKKMLLPLKQNSKNNDESCIRNIVTMQNSFWNIMKVENYFLLIISVSRLWRPDLRSLGWNHGKWKLYKQCFLSFNISPLNHHMVALGTVGGRVAKMLALVGGGENTSIEVDDFLDVFQFLIFWYFRKSSLRWTWHLNVMVTYINLLYLIWSNRNSFFISCNKDGKDIRLFVGDIFKPYFIFQNINSYYDRVNVTYSSYINKAIFVTSIYKFVNFYYTHCSKQSKVSQIFLCCEFTT